MKILEFLLPSLLLPLVLSGCYVDSGRTSRGDIEGYDRYSNKTINVSLLTPTGWDREVTIGGVYVVTQPAPNGGQIYVTSRSFEDFMGDEVSGLDDLEACKELRWSEITDEEIGPKLDRSISESSLAGSDAYEIRYSYLPQGEQESWFVRETLTVVDGKVYRIESYTSDDADLEFQKAVEVMTSSYRLLK